MTKEDTEWFCTSCGRLLAVITAGSEAASQISIVCKRCKTHNLLDLRTLQHGAGELKQKNGEESVGSQRNVSGSATRPQSSKPG